MSPRPHGPSLALFLWVLLAAAIVRLWLMPLPSSFWVDEMATAFVVEHGASHPSFAAAPQVPDSIYYWLPRASVALFGRSEIAYRIPGILVMAAGLWLMGALAARLIHPGARWFAVFACLAMHGIDYYAVDARPYGLAIAVAAAAMWFLVRWLDTARWTDAALFALFAALLWRIHLLDWPMYLVFGVYAAARAREKVGWRRAAAVGAAVAISLVPVALHAVGLAREAGAHVITALPGWREFLHQTRLNLVAFCLAGAWLLRKFGKAARPHGGVLPVAAWWLLPPVCLFALSHLSGESVFVTRYISLALPGAALAATLAASFFLPLRFWRPAALVVGAGALAAFGQWNRLWPQHEHSGWREAAALVNRLANADTPVICPSPYIEARPPVWSPDYRLPGFLYAHLAYYPVSGHLVLFPFQALPDTVPTSGPVVIYGPRGGTELVRKSYSARGWHGQTWEFGDVDVIRMEPNAGAAIAPSLVEDQTLEAKMDYCFAGTLSRHGRGSERSEGAANPTR